MGIKIFEFAYKWRYVPLIVATVNLIVILLLKFVWSSDLGKVLYYSVIFFIASFIFMRAMNQQRKEKEQEEDLMLNPPPPLTKEEVQQIYEKEIQDEIDQQRSNIGFRLVYLVFGVLVFLASITLFLNGEYLFGAIVLIFSLGFIIHSIFVLRKWISYLKFFKEEKKKNIFDEDK